MWMQLKISNDIITQNIPEVLDQQHLRKMLNFGYS